MAGTIIADYIRTDANKISLNVGNTVIASINASGILSNTGTVLISPSGTINGANITSGTIPSGALAAGSVARTNMYSGAVLQVVQTAKTDTFVGSTLNTWTDITGLSVTITPTSATSKIMVTVSLQGGSYDGIEKASWKLVRNSTSIGIGDAASNRPRATGDQGGPNQYWPPYSGVNFLDSPNTTSALTYKLQYLASGSAVFWVNRAAADRDQTYLDSRTISTITVMEIAA